MKLTPYLLLLPTLLATTAHCAPEPLSDTDVDNWSALAQALYIPPPSSFTHPQPTPLLINTHSRKPYTITIPTKTASLNLESISPPPHSVIHQVITAVPPTALAQLFVPAKRSALASDFKAGKTPEWYRDLPTDVKSYISVVKREIATGTETGAGVVKETGKSSSGGVRVRGEVVGVGLGMGMGVVWVVGMMLW
ncbi:hypothetical protein ASPCADRAFT_407016 [Aspergillus carbonarius ITEM 5010]|uniref:Uncharacterized protein n=1 Tax=Aspergillus carbonarius (strain ITEM 5010) TaxID=602072 RepID=A0A1R3RIF9_ASPC5|nr:hypothetical protein ASPCADRAFT_407016 [Aspergillus carbonarius ITEM 5010]